MKCYFKAVGYAVLILLLAIVWALIMFAMTHSWAAGDVVFWVTAAVNYAAFFIEELGPKKRKKEA